MKLYLARKHETCVKKLQLADYSINTSFGKFASNVWHCSWTRLGARNGANSSYRNTRLRKFTLNGCAGGTQPSSDKVGMSAVQIALLKMYFRGDFYSKLKHKRTSQRLVEILMPRSSARFVLEASLT